MFSCCNLGLRKVLTPDYLSWAIDDSVLCSDSSDLISGRSS